MNHSVIQPGFPKQIYYPTNPSPEGEHHISLQG